MEPLARSGSGFSYSVGAHAGRPSTFAAVAGRRSTVEEQQPLLDNISTSGSSVSGLSMYGRSASMPQSIRRTYSDPLTVAERHLALVQQEGHRPSTAVAKEKFNEQARLVRTLNPSSSRIKRFLGRGDSKTEALLRQQKAEMLDQVKDQKLNFDYGSFSYGAPDTTPASILRSLG